MTQSELAERSDTSQSAISMFESGRPDAVADDKLRAIAEILGIDLDTTEALSKEALIHIFENKYCPNPDCPCNAPYLVAGQVCVLICTVSSPAGERTRCQLCGEILEARCPNSECRASVTHGTFCAHCGHAYITAIPPAGQSAEIWVQEGQERIRALTELTRNTETLIRGKRLSCLPSPKEGDPPHVI
ncbi:MAG: helix-turn-helix transcriptional regulator [Kiritimatiellae bacterium]|nr:helix-turn-helix transcriptional regulator [Kiritimatiellia bacterium]